jgi:hypothetical protein
MLVGALPQKGGLPQKAKMTESDLQESDSSGLRFDSHDDALNFVGKLVQHGNDWCAVNRLNFVERYKEGQIVIKLEFVSGRDFRHYQLLFLAVPSGWSKDASAQTKPPHLVDNIREHDRAQNAVLISTSKGIQCPKEIVPSFVWVTRAYDVPNVLWQASAATFEGVLKFGDALPDREIFRMRRQRAQSVNGTDSLIQSVSKVNDGIASVSSEGQWHGFTQFELDHLPDAVLAYLNNTGAGVFVVKQEINLFLNFCNVMLCPRDAGL